MSSGIRQHWILRKSFSPLLSSFSFFFSNMKKLHSFFRMAAFSTFFMSDDNNLALFFRCVLESERALGRLRKIATMAVTDTELSRGLHE